MVGHVGMRGERLHLRSEGFATRASVVAGPGICFENRISMRLLCPRL